MKPFLLVLYFVLLITLVVVGVLFAKENSYLVTLSIFGREGNPVPIWIVLVASFFWWNYC